MKPINPPTFIWSIALVSQRFRPKENVTGHSKPIEAYRR
jgi:hypothetical protein